MRHALANDGFPSSIFSAWEAEGITKLLPIQVRAVETGVLAGKSCIVTGPTSCGKTFVGEMVCVKQTLLRRPCLYLVPFRALAEEKHAEFQRKYTRPEIGASILISTSDHREHDRRLAEGDFNIAILTYEKLSVLLVLHPGILSTVGVLIVDEIQMLGDETRGAELELLLTRARQVAPNLQILALSAVVSDLNGLDGWLDAEVVSDPHRPVPLREGVIAPSGHFRFLEWIGPEKRAGEEHLYPLSGDNEEAMAANLAGELLRRKGEQVLVFAATVASTKSLARAIAEVSGALPAAKKIVEALTLLEASDSVTALSHTLAHSVAFHNADLTLEERLAIEEGFRSGSIRCVVSTSTLSMGVNLPASTVIVTRPRKWTKDASGRWQEVPVTVAEYRNMSGRAGRFGLTRDSFGRSVLIASSPIDQESMFRTYVEGDCDPLESALLKPAFDVLLLRTLASGMCNTDDGCRRFFLKTFAAREAWSSQASQDQLDEEISATLADLESHELVERVKDRKLRVTSIGSICAYSGLPLDSFAQVVDLVRSGNTSMGDIAFVASGSRRTGPDAVGIRFPTSEHRSETSRYVQLLRRANEVASGKLTTALLEDLSGSVLPPYDQAKAIKFQAIAHAFASGVASQDIEEQFDTSGARARGVGSMCSWLSDAAAQVAWTLGRVDKAKQYELLSERFHHGCSETALFLTHVPHRLHRAEREAVVLAGFSSLQKIIDTPAVEIAKTAKVSKARVESLQKGILDTLGASLKLERQQLSRLMALGLSVGPVELLYTAQGKALEQAIEDILTPPFCSLCVARIARQREGEADLKIVLMSGQNGIAQVHAKERPTDRVGLVKAGSVLQQSPDLKPQAFVCFGRPDFMDDAIRKSADHARNGRNYKLIPISVLAEAYVRFHERRLPPTRIAEILEKETGYITIDRL